MRLSIKSNVCMTFDDRIFVIMRLVKNNEVLYKINQCNNQCNSYTFWKNHLEFYMKFMQCIKRLTYTIGKIIIKNR